MGVVVAIVVGALVLALIAWSVLSIFGVGGEFGDPSGAFVVVASKLARRVNERRSRRHPLPPHIPSPPRWH